LPKDESTHPQRRKKIFARGRKGHKSKSDLFDIKIDLLRKVKSPADAWRFLQLIGRVPPSALEEQSEEDEDEEPEHDGN
jgi:hypothetical protein